MKYRLLISAGVIAAFAAFAGAQESPAPGSSTVAEPGTSTHQEVTRQTTETTAVPAPSPVNTMDSSSTVTVIGTVRTYEAGKSVTIVRPNGSTVTYVINPSSELPSDMTVGKKVTVTTTSVSGSPQPVVQRVIYTTKTTTRTVEPPK